MTACTWMTLHLLRFPEPLEVDAVNLMVGPDRAILGSMATRAR